MTNPIHIISLGAGVQSSTMALMAKHGEITPMPTCAIFADTQAEPASVYRWLDFLEKELPFPVHRITAGSLEWEITNKHERKNGGYYSRSSIPAYIVNPDGSHGMTMRGCTYDFKVVPLAREMRTIMKQNNSSKVISWVGISLDEAHRMKPSRHRWEERRWPLTERGIRRRDCIDWMQMHGYPTPPRSACVFCPFHNNYEWRRLRDKEPKEFERAIKVEKLYQLAKEGTAQSGVPFLHASRVPLEEVDFRTAEEMGQLNLFGNECEGMCGV